MRGGLVGTLWMVGVAMLGCPFLPDHEQERGANGTFIAQANDFRGYDQWQHVVVATTPDATGHNAAPRTVYVSALPGPGQSVWPVGTMLVKTGSGLEAQGQTGNQVHAMVKRGGTYNSDGAVGWEWFELEGEPSTAQIQWRGESPPSGESYGCLVADCGTSTLVCNDCHGDGTSDHVLSAALQLDVVTDTQFVVSP
jgi:hypothetical protein